MLLPLSLFVIVTYSHVTSQRCQLQLTPGVMSRQTTLTFTSTYSNQVSISSFIQHAKCDSQPLSIVSTLGNGLKCLAWEKVPQKGTVLEFVLQTSSDSLGEITGCTLKAVRVTGMKVLCVAKHRYF